MLGLNQSGVTNRLPRAPRMLRPALAPNVRENLMISCRELTEILGDLVADELPPEQKADAERHIQECPACSNLYDTYRVTILLARRLPLVPMPPGLMDRL